MRISAKFILIILLATQPLCAMNSDDEQSLVINRVRSPEQESIIINIRPRTYTDIVNQAVWEEHHAIATSTTFEMLKQKIKKINDPEVREKVTDFITSDIDELHEAIDISDTTQITELVKKHLGTPFRLPTNVPVLTKTRAKFCAPANPDETYDLSEEFREHVRDILINGTPEKYDECASHFRRLQFYTEYLYPLAETTSMFNAAKRLGILSTSLIYFPIEFAMSLSMHPILLPAIITLQLAHTGALTYVEHKKDLSKDQKANHILNLVASLRRISKNKASEITELATQLRKGNRILEQIRADNSIFLECKRLALQINGKLEQGYVPENYSAVRTEILALFQEQNYEELKNSLEQLYTSMQQLESKQ